MLELRVCSGANALQRLLPEQLYLPPPTPSVANLCQAIRVARLNLSSVPPRELLAFYSYLALQNTPYAAE